MQSHHERALLELAEANELVDVCTKKLIYIYDNNSSSNNSLNQVEEI